MIVMRGHKETAGRIAASFCLLVSCLAGLAATAVAADDTLVLRQDPAAVSAYWTEERLRAARPLPLPEPVSDGDREALRTFGGQRAEGLAFSEAVERPAPPDPSLAVQLFDPADDLDTKAVDEGAYAPKADSGSAPGAVFTQSRVFPDAAVRQWPYRLVGQLFFSNSADLSDPRALCTAALIARRLILTAGHCVLDRRGVRRNFAFAPAFTRGRAPFGLWFGTTVWVADAWRRDPTVPNYADYALIELADQRIGGRRVAIGDHVGGWFGFELFADPVNHITSLGYPQNLDNGRRLQQTLAQIFDQDNVSLAVLFGTLQGGGSSGGPVVVDFGVSAQGQLRNKNAIIAVNSFGPIDLTGASILNEEFLEIFNQACASRRNNCDQTTAVADTPVSPGRS